MYTSNNKNTLAIITAILEYANNLGAKSPNTFIIELAYTGFIPPPQTRIAPTAKP